MTEFQSEFDKEELLTEDRGIVLALTSRANGMYDLSQWILPWWISEVNLYLILVAIGVALLWGRFEIARTGLFTSLGASRDRATNLVSHLISGGLAITALGTFYYAIAPSTTIQPCAPFVTVNTSTLSPVLLGIDLLVTLQLICLVLPPTDRDLRRSHRKIPSS
jgi:hypothetical protein